MLVAITGTPGTGKSTIAKELKKFVEIRKRYEIIELSDFAKKHKCFYGYDKSRNAKIFNLKKIENLLPKNKSLILVSHISHLLEPEIAIVLRTKHKVLKKRLSKRFYTKKTNENVDAEFLNVIGLEARELCKTVYEIDTTKNSKQKTAKIIKSILVHEIVC